MRERCGQAFITLLSLVGLPSAWFTAAMEAQVYLLVSIKLKKKKKFSLLLHLLLSQGVFPPCFTRVKIS